jgi:hypothetical protein
VELTRGFIVAQLVPQWIPSTFSFSRRIHGSNTFNAGDVAPQGFTRRCCGRQALAKNVLSSFRAPIQSGVARRETIYVEP